MSRSRPYCQPCAYGIAYYEEYVWSSTPYGLPITLTDFWETPRK